jgi:DNA polymerase-3 subunit alpha
MLLNCHTYYSLKYGTLKLRQVLAFAQEADWRCFALTDINNTSTSLDFVRLAPEYGIRPVLGIDFRNGAQQCYVGIAKNNLGFKELNEHLSDISHKKEAFEVRAPRFKNSFIVYPFSSFAARVNAQKESIEKALDQLEDHEFIGVAPRDIGRIIPSAWRYFTHKMLAMPTASFRHKKDFNAHRLLRAIDKNVLLSKLQKNDEGKPDDLFLNRATIERAYNSFPELITRSEKLLEQCHIAFDFGSEHPHKNLSSYTGNKTKDIQLIRRLVNDGLKYRYPQPNKAILSRIEKELGIIEEKDFISYFLINWDITHYARSKGYFYVGRGSGANSIIAYILRITDVDPIELDLYFERFINLYRQNPPDFDIDFSWTDRDDVTRYIFERFPHVTLLGAYVTFQYRAVVRELGKVFGLPKADIDLLSSGKFRFDELDQLAQLVLKYSTLIQGFPNHVSIHAAGILISEKPISNYTATFLPPKGFPTTHFDMIVAEDVGLYKFDILSQRGLGKIKDCVEIVRANHPEEEPLDIHDMKRFKQDERIKELLRTADAIGCFYVESPAMRMLMRKLRVDDYLGLVAASSVIRPGVAQSGMMREYILRYRFPERRQDAHPVMLDIMPETFGVMVYQEDVIKVAHYFAGLDLGEADVLRRGMSGKFRSREEFESVKEKFFSNCKEKGYDDALTAEIWRQTESFAGYAFAKGHSASYAVESFQSLYLKAYFPIEYMVATLNNSGGFYRTEYYIHEARMKGAHIEEPCVNNSGALSVVKGSTVYLGFGLLKSIEHKAIEKLLAARKYGGSFESLLDFVDRVQPALEQLVLLIRCNAFRFTGFGKKALLWEAYLLLGHQSKSSENLSLFKPEAKRFVLPDLDTAPLEHIFDEMELYGFPLKPPFPLLEYAPANEVFAKDLRQLVGQEVTVVAYIVTIKPTKTAKGKMMYFGTFLDRNGDWIDSVHFPPVAAAYPFRGKGIYAVTGKVSEEFDCYTIEVSALEKLPIVPDPRYAEVKGVVRRSLKA